MDLNKLSQNAREVLDIANAVVRRGRSNQLGTEHILLGLLAQQGGVVHRVFEELGLDLGLAQTKTNEAIRRNDLARSRTAAERVQMTYNARNAIRLAGEEAERSASDYIGTEHLLLALASEPEGVATRILTDLETDREGLRAEVMTMIGGEGRLGSSPNF